MFQGVQMYIVDYFVILPCGISFLQPIPLKALQIDVHQEVVGKINLINRFIYRDAFVSYKPTLLKKFEVISAFIYRLRTINNTAYHFSADLERSSFA